MKRKENAVPKDVSSLIGVEEGQESVERPEDTANDEDKRLFLMDDGQLKSFSDRDYTTSILYQVVESFEVERRLVPPETSNNITFEGKRPSKKTVPIVVSKDERCTLLDSWEELETKTDQLADAQEVIGAVPVKQVFVLKKK